jgi:DNA polymerase epsilon subunit 3
MSADSAPSTQPQPQILREDHEEMDIEEEEGAEDEDVEVDVYADEVEEEEEEEGVEEVQDMMALEEEEMRKDAKMVEENVKDTST